VYIPVQKEDKFFLHRARPVSAIEYLIFDPLEEAFTRRVI
jgi:hypothetical protein